MVRLTRIERREENGKIITDTIEVIVPYEELENPDGRYETCAICNNRLYPECTEHCGILRKDLEFDKRAGLG